MLNITPAKIKLSSLFLLTFDVPHLRRYQADLMTNIQVNIAYYHLDPAQASVDLARLDDITYAIIKQN